MSIRVVTLNLWGRGDAWEERRPVLADGVGISIAIHPDDPGHTFTPSNPPVPSRSNPMVVDGERVLEVGRRVDHIMVRCGHHGPTLDVVACERIFDEPVDGVWASDHFGVMADLEVPS
jgi:hypothetical protein